jgi:amphi-Trp domain-containing protein
MTKGERDVDKVYSVKDSVAKLRRLADALEAETPFRIQVAGERIRVPKRAEFSVEHERDEDSEEIELQLRWSLRGTDEDDDEDDDEDGPLLQV